MTDPTAAPAAAPVGAPINWENVAALAIAAATMLGGMLAVCVLRVDQAVAHGFCDPIVLACAVVYQRGAA
jgi:hypothetical protein